ncbi:MAG: hypothetical protein HZB40_07690 [Rhodocyclales bacterium]|nr:hypothetical protein [Rhodocyclales bacterium]
MAAKRRNANAAMGHELNTGLWPAAGHSGQLVIPVSPGKIPAAQCVLVAVERRDWSAAFPA